MGRQTDHFYEEIRGSHRVVSYVDVVTPDLEVIRLPAIEGRVDCDASATYRRKCSVECIDPTGTLTPRREGEVLTPYGTEIRPYRGVEYTSGPLAGTQEICPLGVFRLSSSNISDSLGGSPHISLEGVDRSRIISRDKFKAPYIISAGTNALTAIQQIVAMTYPEIEYDTISTTVATSGPMLFDAGSDPWEAVMNLAISMGCEAYFTVEGRLAVLPPQDVSALPAPDFTLIEGEGCTMLDLQRKYTDEPGFNGVIVTGEAIGDELPPVRAEAWDENPTSPTYRHGPYGEVPMFHTDNLAKTETQAEVVAKSLLAGMLGFDTELAITATPNPSYEAGDIVAVRRDRAGVDGIFAVEAFSVPFRANGSQSLILRIRRPA